MASHGGSERGWGRPYITRGHGLVPAAEAQTPGDRSHGEYSPATQAQVLTISLVLVW